MSGPASVTHAQRQGLVFFNPDHISSVREISKGTEITLTVLSFGVVALLATIIKGLASVCDSLRKKLVRFTHIAFPADRSFTRIRDAG